MYASTGGDLSDSAHRSIEHEGGGGRQRARRRVLLLLRHRCSDEGEGCKREERQASVSSLSQCRKIGRGNGKGDIDDVIKTPTHRTKKVMHTCSGCTGIAEEEDGRGSSSSHFAFLLKL